MSNCSYPGEYDTEDTPIPMILLNSMTRYYARRGKESDTDEYEQDRSKY